MVNARRADAGLLRSPDVPRQTRRVHQALRKSDLTSVSGRPARIEAIDTKGARVRRTRMSGPAYWTMVAPRPATLIGLAFASLLTLAHPLQQLP